MVWIVFVIIITTMKCDIALFRKGWGMKLSILRSILNEAIDYRTGRDDVDAIGHVLDSKPKAVQDL